MKKVFLLALSAIILSSCGNNSTKSQNNQEKVSSEEHHHDEEANAIQLNHGEKWVVNNEMKPFVLEGENLVNGYLENNDTDHKILAEEIKAQNSMLVKSCTMKGESHEALHKWLHPHLELVKTLKTETDKAKASEIILQLQQSYQTYRQYFN
ncbi:hypothetical protein [Pedobacter arcticus]|uniref:hypothetical protein n=1 Tax=Pedobacter arcticus TaxID=752140 RepID=UPI0002EC06A2|nr:hypothetical protein [Pedobacter arcticus]